MQEKNPFHLDLEEGKEEVYAKGSQIMTERDDECINHWKGC